jgi:hypothetical protein
VSAPANGAVNTHKPLDSNRLDAAVSVGILSVAQAERLADFWTRSDEVKETSSPVSHTDAEEVRFVRGFHDVFIAIGIVILLFGLIYGLRNVGPAWVVAGSGAITVWVLSEVFARKLRLALPSFLLSITFTPMFYVSCVALLADNGNDFSMWEMLGAKDASRLILPSLIATCGAALHYYRFKIPVGLTGVLAGMLVVCSVMLETFFPGFLEHYGVWFVLFAGAACFVFAMVFDSRDRERVTANSDKAFWLHLMAAPLLVHSLLLLIAGEGTNATANYAFLVIVVFLTLAVSAIIVDRRALLVSGLGYFGVAIASLMTQAELSQDITLAITLILLGCFILLLGSSWRLVRRIVVAPFAATPLMRLVPAIT